jgi:hypothetical protein
MTHHPAEERFMMVMDMNDQTREAEAELLSKLEDERFSAMLECDLWP